MMLIDSKFKIGDTVFLKSDYEQSERLLTGLSVRQNGVTYGLSCGTVESWHYDFEITVEKNVMKSTMN
jgi:hypothetical protein